jgi:hypothetical protein
MLTLALLALVLTRVVAETCDHRSKEFIDRYWRPGVPVPIAVHEGHAKFQVPANATRSDVLVIVSTLATAPGPYPLTLEAAPAATSDPPEVAEPKPSRAPKLAPLAAEAIPIPTSGVPPSEREFSLMVRDGDVTSASNYVRVRAVLRAVGRRVQVYVGSEDVPEVGANVFRDLVSTFDDRIFPVAAATVGLARDVDGDGRFTVLLSSWLSRLGQGTSAVDGFVRVSDLDLAYSAPFGNRCDMMYLSAGLKPGPHLRTVLTHEYMHAVVFSGKVRHQVGAKSGILEEEGWLDEALAHLAEDQQAFSRSNIDYRISAFLSHPERYQLVVDDYYAANLFRSHGNRGCTYLFLRWCVDQYGPGLVPALIQSPLRGIKNLEAATGCGFDDLFRRWTLALFTGGMEPIAPAEKQEASQSPKVRGLFDEWAFAGPRVHRVAVGGAPNCWTAAGTTSHFVLVPSSAAAATEVTVRAPREAQLQVTAMCLPPDLPSLEFAVRAAGAADGDLRLRATIRAMNGEPLSLTALTCEPLVPAVDSQAQGIPRGSLDTAGIAASFGQSELAGGSTLHSREICFKGVHAGSGALIIKLVGADRKGRRVTAWQEIENADPDSTGHTEAAPDQPLAGTIH